MGSSVGGLGHARLVSSEWKSLNQLLKAERKVTVDGQNLSLADVVAVTNYGAEASLTQNLSIIKIVNASVSMLRTKVHRGDTMYGINTGFGASADVRTSETEELQRGLLQLLNVGILLPSDKGSDSADETDWGMQAWRSHALPVSVVRGMLLIRANSLMRGHSGVRVEVIQAMLTLLEKGMTPVVPLRGSISASGDLSPLSYIAAVLEGNPDVHVRLGSHGSNFLRSDQALKLAGLEPIRLQAKEGLGIVNGTATSTAAASIAMHQAHQLAILSQFLTAVATEALLGTENNYHQFISECRPHPGQIEAAANIFALLSGSKLARGEDTDVKGLVQDRYALRTAPQWIGPQLENLMLAHQQVQIEINSTTDNPLIDVNGGFVHQGGNFQAAAITSAMEKVSSSMQLLGKLMFAQCTELLDTKMNKLLPPNLAADDPSKSFTMKGLDINMAAYMSELAHLAHPVSAHVQSSEMSNQSVNSLALLASRNALESIEVLSLMAASFIYVLCQALDLRCLHLEFCGNAEPAILEVFWECFGPLLPSSCLDEIHGRSWEALLRKWCDLSSLDLEDRGRTAVREATGELLEILGPHLQACQSDGLGDALQRYFKESSERLCLTYARTRSEFFENPTTATYLGTASKALYDYVRNALGLPMHRGLRDHPSTMADGQVTDEGQGKIIGTMVSEVYVALRNGSVHDVVVTAMELACGFGCF